MTSTIEFVVQMTCDSCVMKIENSLKSVEGIESVNISKDERLVLVESELPPNVIKEKIESTGRKALLTGSINEPGENENICIDKGEFISGLCSLCKSEPRSDDMEGNKPDVGDSHKNNETNIAKNNNADGQSKIKRLKLDSEYRSDDEEELELKYSSDSDDEFENRNIFSAADGNDVWKIVEEDFDVIDADGADDDAEENQDQAKTDKSDLDTSNKSESGQKRKMTSQSGSESDDEAKSDSEKIDKTDKKKKQNSRDGKKFISKMKPSVIRKGNFNMTNSHISLQVIILCDDPEDENLKVEEAQTLKDTLCKELFKRGYKIRQGEPEIIQLRFTDCKLVQPGWLLITCDDKPTYDWLMAWEIPVIANRSFKSIPASSKAPPQTIKFNIKTSWIPNDETMLKLIHLQNRNIDTKVWDLKNKKSVGNRMEQFHFEVDCGTVRALEKSNWSFFYELFTVKIIEANGKTINAQSR